MAGGGGGGKSWIYALVGGCAVLGVAHVAHESIPGVAHAAMLALGGLAVVFGSCEAMIKSVEGIGARVGLNQFVAGTLAGLASNVPELVMLGFVVAATPRVGFIVTCLTLHVGALAFGLYSALLPRDETGHARLPKALVNISTDLYAAAAGVFIGTGGLMIMLKTFEAGEHAGEGLGATDLYVLGVALLFVEVVAIKRLIARFSSDDPTDDDDTAEEAAAKAKAAEATEANPPSWGAIAGFGALGIVTSVIGGHAVGDFSDILVTALTERGYTEMFGAIVLSIFAAAGAFAMIITAHTKGMYDVALASASGQISQVPFVVLPLTMIMMAAFSQMGIIPTLPNGGVLPIDLETTSVIFLSFPPMLMLWKSVQDDGQVNWVETASMVTLFGLTIYFLAQHG